MKEKQSHDFIQKLLALVIPIAFQQFMLALVSASDALMLGMLTQDALSAVSLAGQITFVENLFFAAMAIGLSMFAAQYWGKGDRAAVERIFAYVMKITVAVSFLFFIAGFIMPGAFMCIFTNEQTLIEGGRIYLRTVSLAFLLTGISQVYLCILKNTGRAAKSSVISSVSVVVNIILNAIFIFGWFGLPEMGIAGAALATVTARAIEAAWCVIETVKKDSIKLKLYYMMHEDKVLRHDFWKYSFPVLGNEIVWGMGFTMYSVIMGHLGSDAVAANSFVIVVRNFGTVLCFGIASAGGILLGNIIGEDRLEDARQDARKLMKLTILSGAFGGLLILAITPFVLMYADLTDTAMHYLKYMLLINTYYVMGAAVNTTLIAGVFRAGGDSRFGFICDVIDMWVYAVPLGFLAAFVFKLPVMWVYFLLCTDEFVKWPWVIRHYRSDKWLHNITRDNIE